MLALFTTIIFSFVLALMGVKFFIRKMREKGLVVKDYHKKGRPMVPNDGGIATLFAVFITMIITPIFFRLIVRIGYADSHPVALTTLDTAILTVILLYAFYGVLDDYIDVGRPSKLIIPLLFAYPLVLALPSWNAWIPFVGEINVSSSINLLGGTFTLSQVIRYVIVPVYIMVVANLKNMHSGLNGLQSGLALIILIFILIKSFMINNIENMYTVAAVTGATLAFFWYNKHPSKIFEGNIGTFAVGAAIGSAIIVQHFLFAGFIMLLPHTINFLMYVYWRVQRKRHPDDVRWKSAKFGKIREDGTLEVPNPLTLKWVLPYYRRMTEKQATTAMYCLTLICCVAALFVPG